MLRRLSYPLAEVLLAVSQGKRFRAIPHHRLTPTKNKSVYVQFNGTYNSHFSSHFGKAEQPETERQKTFNHEFLLETS